MGVKGWILGFRYEFLLGNEVLVRNIFLLVRCVVLLFKFILDRRKEFGVLIKLKFKDSSRLKVLEILLGRKWFGKIV